MSIMIGVFLFLGHIFIILEEKYISKEFRCNVVKENHPIQDEVKIICDNIS